MIRPMLKKNLRFEPLSNNHSVIFDEIRGHTLLTGSAYNLLCECLEQGLNLDEILAKASEFSLETEIYYAIFTLEKKGYLREYDPLIDEAKNPILEFFNSPPQKAVEMLHKYPLQIRSLGCDQTENALSFFSQYPFSFSETPKMHVILTDSYSRDELVEWNRAALNTQTPWILAKVTGHVGLISPVFNPGHTPCFECLLQSLKRNQFHEFLILNKDKKQSNIQKPLSYFEPVIFSKLSNLVMQWIIEQGDMEKSSNSTIKCSLSSLEFPSSEWKEHCFQFASSCPGCKYQYLPTSQIWDLKSKPIVSFDGGYRTTHPEQTFDLLKKHISPLTGWIEEVKRSEGTLLDQTNSYVYAALHCKIRGTSKNYLLAGKYKDTSGGKGVTEIQAKAGAVCEAIERMSGIYRGNEPKVFGKMQEISPDAICPNSCMLFSDMQYENRHLTNLNAHPFNIVTRPFNADTPTDWTALWSLTHKKTKWIPTAFCYYGYPVKSNEEPFCIANSNGCASGNSLEEAILQAIFELVERDSVALWWYSRIQMPKVDLASFKNPYFDQIVEQCLKNGRELWVLDITFDLNIPAFVAVSRKINEHPETILFGFGCHIDPVIGISRAITELCQVFKAVDGNLESVDEKAGLADWILSASLEKEYYLKPSSKIKTKDDYYVPYFLDIKDVVLYCQKQIEAKGMEILVLNQTREDIDFPVVRVVIPGIRHFWSRFAPGRLYDIPFELGYVSKRLNENELNPIHMFI